MSEAKGDAKGDAIKYFVDEYRKMLQQNLQDYIDNFDNYMQIAISGEDTQ